MYGMFGLKLANDGCLMMNSFKNSNQGRRMREWNDNHRPRQDNNPFFQSKPYLAARRKVMWERVHAYMIIACAIGVIGILLFWPN